MAEIKSLITIIVKKQDKEFVFSCENGSDLGTAYSAYCEMGQWFVEKITEAENQKQPIVENEEKKEDCQNCQ